VLMSTTFWLTSVNAFVSYPAHRQGHIQDFGLGDALAGGPRAEPRWRSGGEAARTLEECDVMKIKTTYEEK